MKSDNPGVPVFEYQPPGVLNQAAPVNGTYYYILGTALVPAEKVRVYQAAVNVEDNDETLELEIVLDGEIIQPVSLACTHSTAYWAYIDTEPIARVERVRIANSQDPIRYRAFLCEGYEVQIRVRKITAAGAGNLTGIVTWGKKRSS